jgi:hypothetical protein
MTLRHHEAIALGIVVTGNVEHPAVECRDHVGHRQRRAYVAHVGALRLLEHDPPDGAPRDG